MRHTIKGLIAAIAVFTSAPAFACGGFNGGCSPCGGYVSPCAQTYVQPVTTCATGCGYAVHERLPDSEDQYQSAAPMPQQYYYVDQGPTYTGPGDFAPRRVYREGGISGWHGYRHHRQYGYGYRHHWHHAQYGYGYRRHQPVLRSYY